MVAASLNHPKIVSLLFARGAAIDATDNSGWTALIRAWADQIDPKVPKY